jgi:hypothetical protein
MELTIQHQETYSRLELLLRSFFGWIFIGIPHGFLLFFAGLWGAVLSFIAFWVILFTGRYPQSMFEFRLGLLRWSLRLNARMMNLSDGYPAFGINSTDENTNLKVDYPESLSRGTLLLKVFFGWIYVMIPHGFILFFLYIGAMVVMFLAFWIVLFTGKYPVSMHNYMVGLIRWGTRVGLYIGLMTDEYPPFSLT